MIDLVGGKGQQQPTPTAEETQKRAEGGAFLGAFGGSADDRQADGDAGTPKADDRLARVVEAWPTLSEGQRAAILRTVTHRK